MTKYLNFFESESGFTESVEAGQLFYPNVSYTEDDDTVHWNLARSVETPMLRMSFSTSTPGQEVALHRGSDSVVTAMEIDGTPVNFASGGTYTIAEPGNHTAVYQFTSSTVPERLFRSDSGEFDTFTSAEITSAVTTVSGRAFSGCSGLTSVTIPDSVNTIGKGAFNSCSSLQSVVLPDNLTVIEDFAFTNCTSLQSVVLPDNLTAIENSAFFGCGSLYEVYIPSGVTSIGVQAFYLCSGLTAIYFNSQVPPTLGTDALDQTAFTSATDCPIYVPAEAVETYKSAWPKYAYRIKTKHRISASVNDETLGEVNVEKETAPEGDTVLFHVEVSDSEQNQVSSVTVTDGNGDNVQVTDEGDNSYSFDMPASDVTISVTIGEKPKYNISASVNDDSLGRVDVLNGETANEGDLVDFHVDVFEMDRYQVSSVSITDGNGDEVEYEGDEYDYSFTMPDSDVTISVEIGEKEKTNYAVTVNSTDDLVTDVAIINEETGDWNWDYEGELSFPEGEFADFAIRVPEGYLAVSAQASDCDGNSIGDVNMNRLGDDCVYECMFTMPYCDASVFITVEADTRPRYNISASVNDDSLGVVNVQETALEGETFFFDVKVFDTDANHVSSVTCTDGNGNEIKCWWDFDERDYSRYHINDMPASNVTISVVIGPKQ